MRVEIMVKSLQKGYVFRFIAHKAMSEAELRLPISFYEGKVITYPQWEAEIVEPMVARADIEKLKCHYSDKDNKPYVCYPDSMPNTRVVMDVLAAWAIEQVCVIELDLTLSDLIAKAGSQKNIVPWAKAEHSIYQTWPSSCAFQCP